MNAVSYSVSHQNSIRMPNVNTEYLCGKEQQLKQLQEELDRLKNDERLKAELDFKNHLETLMRKFDKSAADVINLLDPTPTANKTSSSTKPQAVPSAS